ncbi:hypothetical protein [Streptomyces iakyrus]|uniref:hypothetical protein n=1 Tax=Streptomyces iakyrus TaxID=68219 RepID=UPI0036F5A3BC
MESTLYACIARDIAEAARTSAPEADTPTSHYDQLVARHAKLKRQYKKLTAHLSLPPPASSTSPWTTSA